MKKAIKVLKEIRDFILGMSIFWVPLLACYLSGLLEQIF